MTGICGTDDLTIRFGGSDVGADPIAYAEPLI